MKFVQLLGSVGIVLLFGCASVPSELEPVDISWNAFEKVHVASSGSAEANAAKAKEVCGARQVEIKHRYHRSNDYLAFRNAAASRERGRAVPGTGYVLKFTCKI